MIKFITIHSVWLTRKISFKISIPGRYQDTFAPLKILANLTHTEGIAAENDHSKFCPAILCFPIFYNNIYPSQEQSRCLMHSARQDNSYIIHSLLYLCDT